MLWRTIKEDFMAGILHPGSYKQFEENARRKTKAALPEKKKQKEQSNEAAEKSEHKPNKKSRKPIE